MMSSDLCTLDKIFVVVELDSTAELVSLSHTAQRTTHSHVFRWIFQIQVMIFQNVII